MRISDWSSDVCSSDRRNIGEPRLERFPSPGTEALGIHNFARHGMQSRGVLVNLKDAVGEKRDWVGYDLLMRLMEAQKVTVEQGDMLCLYTGFGDVVMAMQKKPDLPRLENSRSEEHTSELQSLMRISYAVFCLKKKTYIKQN